METDDDDDSGGSDPQTTGTDPVADRISGALKQAYDEVVNAPLPDRLEDLLERLKREKQR